MKLWSINRVLRWTGFRIAVNVPVEKYGNLGLSIVWFGFGFIREARLEDRECLTYRYKYTKLKEKK